MTGQPRRLPVRYFLLLRGSATEVAWTRRASGDGRYEALRFDSRDSMLSTAEADASSPRRHI
jgi:hypothetical protein